jgi:hypothetical protein
MPIGGIEKIVFDISGIQEAQDDNARRIAAMKPKGAAGEAVKHVVVGAHRYVVIITHVDTGTLRAAHRMEILGLRGRIYIDPAARNPYSGEMAEIYGPYEEARGGSHAFYQRTTEEAGPRLVNEAITILQRGVAYGS